MNAAVNNLPCQPPINSSGFTLIELMVTVAVLAIIVSFAGPNISSQLANQRVKSTTATLTNALKEARVESVIRRQTMTMSFNNNGTAAGSISVTDQNTNVIATHQYDVKSTIKATSATIAFEPIKRANAVTYTICDSNLAAAPRQVKVSKLGNVSNQLGGTCP